MTTPITLTSNDTLNIDTSWGVPNPVTHTTDTVYGSILTVAGATTYMSGTFSVDGTTVNGGIEYVESGGTANTTTVNNGGYEYVYSGGVANDTSVNSGGNIRVGIVGSLNAGVTNHAIINAGGQETVFNGGVASDTTVNNSGYEYIGNGGTANGGTVNAGGKEFVDAGSTLKGTTTINDGTLKIAGNVDLTASVIFSGSNGNLLLDSITNFMGTISGFSVGNIIDLTNITSVSSVTWNNNGTLDITTGTGLVDTIKLANSNIVGIGVTTQSDGHGGTDIIAYQPAISGVSYDASTGVLTFSGSHLISGINSGAFTASNASGSYTFNATNDIVGNQSANGFTVALSATDQVAVNAFINSGGSYNLAATAGWDNGGGAATNLSVNVNNVPIISSANYDANTGTFTFAGSHLTNGINLSHFTVSNASGTYTFNATNDHLGNQGANGFTVALSATDQVAVNNFINSSSGNYTVAVAAGWDTNGSGAATSLSVNASNIPSISSGSYDANTATFTFTGSHLTSGINLSHFTFSDTGGTYTFNTTDSIGNFSANGFTVTLNSAEKSAVNAFVNANGATSSVNAAYNLAVSAGWDTNGSGAAGSGGVTASNTAKALLGSQNITLQQADDFINANVNNPGLIFTTAQNHSVTTSMLNEITGYSTSTISTFFSQHGYNTAQLDNLPTLSSISYNEATGVLTLTGNDLKNGITLSDLTLTGQGGKTYTLTGSGDTVSSLTSTSATITLKGNDLSHTNTLLNNDGTQSTDGTALHLGASISWDAGNSPVSGLGITVNHAAQALLSSLGVTVQYANDFINANVNNPGTIFSAAQNHGVTTEMLSEITGYSVAQVKNFFSQHGYDTAQLESPDYIFNKAVNASTTPVTLDNINEGTGQIELSKAVFAAFAGASSVSSANFSNAANSTGATDYLFYDASTGGLYYDADATGSGAAVEIAVVGVNNTHPASLSAADFTLIA